MTETVSELKEKYPTKLSSGQTKLPEGVINNPRKGVEELRADFDHPLAEGCVRYMPPYALKTFNKKLAEALKNKTVNPLVVAKQSRYDR